jgi:hypothetical protein
MLFAFSDSSVHRLGESVAVNPGFRALAPFRQTTTVGALPETGPTTGFPALVAAEPRPRGASREETNRKECA